MGGYHLCLLISPSENARAETKEVKEHTDPPRLSINNPFDWVYRYSVSDETRQGATFCRHFLT